MNQQKSKLGTLRSIVLLLVVFTVIGDTGMVVSEAAVKLPPRLYRQLKGRWYTQASSGGYDIKFTQTRVKYYDRDTGKLAYSGKIKQVKKIRNGLRKGDYRIVFKNVNGVSSYIGSNTGFDYYSGATGYEGYSGSASISEGKWGNFAGSFSKKQVYLKAYRKKLSRCGGQDSFFVYDLNHDGILELILRENYMDTAIYTFYKGKIVRAGSFSSAFMLNYYTKGSVFESGRLLGGVFYTTVYKISKGKIKTVAGKIETESENVKADCSIAGKKVTEKKYNAYINKLTKKSEHQSLECYAVNSSNVKKYLR